MSLKASWSVVLIGLCLQVLLGVLWAFGWFNPSMERSDALTFLAALGIQVLMLYMIYKMDDPDLQRSKLHRILIVCAVMLGWIMLEIMRG